jgi:hypothetical protein
MNINATQLSGAAARNSDAISRSMYYKLAVFFLKVMCVLANNTKKRPVIAGFEIAVFPLNQLHGMKLYI